MTEHVMPGAKLRPVFYAMLFMPMGITNGRTVVVLAYLLSQARVSVGLIAGVRRTESSAIDMARGLGAAGGQYVLRSRLVSGFHIGKRVVDGGHRIHSRKPGQFRMD